MSSGRRFRYEELKKVEDKKDEKVKKEKLSSVTSRCI